MLPIFKHRRAKKSEPRCSMVVVAAGSSTRMEGQDKIMLPLGDIPVLARTLRALDSCRYVTELIVVTRSDLIVPVGQMCHDYFFSKVKKVICGGDTRTQSVLAGIRETDPDANLIAIHDGARPFVTQEILEAVIEKAMTCGAAAPAVSVHDTLKRAERGAVLETLDRSVLYAVQTPQVFEPALIRAALQRAEAEGALLTDDCAAVERLGVTVYLTRGSEENIKLTTPADLNFAAGILWGRGEPL
ncbi:MAG: 2-C-methyl-D-erythritol 4-phosphate cytidylyltransferase [Intestinimonas sp.]|jgi:2-C-methyl-D-erythritol 4-phosphate cytidylyltransferase|nr:2-C-methyl-D-erythritol 4-phosphate cytidylyltransferase [Intestinimonas sp.]